jgi:hypothetical protein
VASVSPKDSIRDVPPGGKEEPSKVSSAPCPLGLGNVDLPQVGEIIGLSSYIKKGAKLSPTVGSPDVDPSTIHATLATDSSRRLPSATVDGSPTPIYSHIRAGLTINGRIRWNRNSQSTIWPVSPAPFRVMIWPSSPSATSRAGPSGKLFQDRGTIDPRRSGEKARGDLEGSER